jgi:hypothetical protein
MARGAVLGHAVWTFRSVYLYVAVSRLGRAMTSSIASISVLVRRGRELAEVQSVATRHVHGVGRDRDELSA